MKTVDLGLPRPQYVSVPEGFIVALAGREFRPRRENLRRGSNTALVYERTSDGRASKTLSYKNTRPTGGELKELGEALYNAGLEVDEHEEQFAESITAAIAGIRTDSGTVRSAVPVSVNLALLQNLRGLVGSKNPPDVAKVIEMFFAMGRPAEAEVKRAGQLWTEAAQRRCAIDPLVRKIDSAISNVVTDGYSAESSSERFDLSDPVFMSSPFSWFHRTWTELCSPVWVDALPARVWVDWANVVLRLAFGMGYLWEVQWYTRIAQQVLDKAPVSDVAIVQRIGELVPWQEPSMAISVRDIASTLRSRVMRSHDIRNEITAWTSRNTKIEGVEDQIAKMSEDDELVDSLREAWSGRGSSNDNLWEAINYTLRTRLGGGDDADYYGLWRKYGRSRFSVVDPGVEWVAALASLACPGPGETTNVGIFMEKLRGLGLRPELSDILARLERAGVAQGSADADQAVEIRSAF